MRNHESLMVILAIGLSIQTVGCGADISEPTQAIEPHPLTDTTFHPLVGWSCVAVGDNPPGSCPDCAEVQLCARVAEEDLLELGIDVLESSSGRKLCHINAGVAEGSQELWSGDLENLPLSLESEGFSVVSSIAVDSEGAEELSIEASGVSGGICP